MTDSGSLEFVISLFRVDEEETLRSVIGRFDELMVVKITEVGWLGSEAKVIGFGCETCSYTFTCSGTAVIRRYKPYCEQAKLIPSCCGC